MRDILDALENVQTNVKKPMDMKKEMNKKKTTKNKEIFLKIICRFIPLLRLVGNP